MIWANSLTWKQKSTDGIPDSASVNQAIINTNGGSVSVTGLTVDSVRAVRDVFRLSDGSTLSVRDSTFIGNVIQRVCF